MTSFSVRSISKADLLSSLSTMTAKQFFSISLAVNLLTDPSKRSFLNGRLEEDKRKKEKTAGMEKKRRTMVEVRLYVHDHTLSIPTLTNAR